MFVNSLMSHNGSYNAVSALNGLYPPMDTGFSQKDD